MDNSISIKPWRNCNALHVFAIFCLTLSPLVIKASADKKNSSNICLVDDYNNTDTLFPMSKPAISPTEKLQEG